MFIYSVSTDSDHHFQDNARTHFQNLLSSNIPEEYTYCSLEDCHMESSFNTINSNNDNMSHIVLCINSITFSVYFFNPTYSKSVTENYTCEIVPGSQLKPSYIYISLKPKILSSLNDIVSYISTVITKTGINKFLKLSINNNKCVLNTSLVDGVYICADLMSVLGFNEKSWPIYPASSLTNIVSEHSLLSIKSRSKKYFVCGNNISAKADQHVNLNYFLPKLIKICSSNVGYSLHGGSQEQVLAVIPAPKTNFSMYSHNVFKPSIIKLACKASNKLDFKLLDENNEILKLGVGSATYLKIKMHKEPTNPICHLTLHSNDQRSKLMFDKNSSTTFSTILAKRLYKKTNDWKINLSHMHLPSKICNITRDICEAKITTHLGLNKAEYKTEYIKLPSGYYNNVIELVQTFNIHLKSHNLIIHLDNSTNTCELENFGLNLIELSLNPILLLVLGYISILPTRKNIPLMMAPHHKLSFKHKININIARPRYARVICDQVQHSSFGSSNEQLLRFVTLKHNNDHNVDICDYEFYNDNSVSIILNPLDVITIRLLSENNDMPIEFHDKNLDSSFSLEIFHV